ncbi:hypothetical protein [Infirmifilum sp. NZ]|uniref:hypothetical protein n=1 Tax=Infirmifilum sp. NZ TaxID=2926850 RepID=UPI00279C693A|nr:hypothetical protein [Infirmifilum sp. NZ]UNQ74403.1 hypothetical protein MOV14_01585 [Infirmifilum sp. NZ]
MSASSTASSRQPQPWRWRSVTTITVSPRPKPSSTSVTSGAHVSRRAVTAVAPASPAARARKDLRVSLTRITYHAKRFFVLLFQGSAF